MSFRSLLRWLVTAIFILLVAPVVGDFFVELARELGLYNRPADRVQAVVDWAQSIFGEQGFFYTLFALGGLVVGLWLDPILKRAEPSEETAVERMAARMQHVFELMPVAHLGDWDRRTPKGTSWQSELGALHQLMMKAGFHPPPMTIDATNWELNLDAHRDHIAHVLPYLEAEQFNMAKMVNYIAFARLMGEIGPDEEIPIEYHESVFKRLIRSRPWRRELQDTESETPP